MSTACLLVIMAGVTMASDADFSHLICSPGNYTCSDGGCVPDSAFCDGVEDCGDRSDEYYCDGKSHGAVEDALFDFEFIKRPDNDREKAVDLCELHFVPTGCTCKERVHVYCDDVGMMAVPFGIHRDTRVLDLSGNKLKTLSPRDFEDLSNLEKMLLMHTGVKLILPGTFQACGNLKELYLTGNEIADIPEEIFSEDNILETLDLRLNRLRVLTPGYFRRLRNLKTLYLLENVIEAIMPSTFENQHKLQHLNLDSNNLQKVSAAYFTGLPSLNTLKLARNRIHYTEASSFLSLRSLLVLDLSSNFIRKLPTDSFIGLWNLTHLNLQQNQIVWIEKGAFKPLKSLISLNVKKNNFHGVISGTFDVMPNLQTIYFDTFYMCVHARHVSKCEPRGDGISSRENLLENTVLRSSVWVVAVLACLGNISVLMGRYLVKEDNAVHSIFIKNLSLADLLMGVYLLVLATHDLRYRGHYLSRDGEWRESWGCDLCGILTTISSEASVLTLTAITMDRYICILYPLKTRRRTLTSAYVIMLAIWGCCVGMAVLPVMGLRYFGTFFYRNNAVCIPLFLHDPRGDGWEYSAFIFVGVNLTSFLFVAYAYVAMFLAIRRSNVMTRPVDECQERCLMKRFFFIVVTDFMCWMPIIGLKAGALAGVEMSGDFYAWVVVFILPVNCALNPLLYTLTTKLFKHNFMTTIAHVVCRRRSLEVSSTSTLSGLKFRTLSQPSSKCSSELEFSQIQGKNKICYNGKMKYKYSHGKVIYPSGKSINISCSYTPVST